MQSNNAQIDSSTTSEDPVNQPDDTERIASIIAASANAKVAKILPMTED